MKKAPYCVQMIAAFMITVIGFANPALACTTFSSRNGDQLLIGKTYDWNSEVGYLLVNKRNVAKSSMAIRMGDKPVSWVSNLGSLTFNQYGRELPNAGMNEAGLVVEVMVLGASRYPLFSSRPSVNESQWVQYILDQARTLDEAVALSSSIRISKILIPLHYLVCEASGACAAFEVLAGNMKVTRGSELSVPVMTNSVYADAIKHLGLHTGFGGTRAIPTGTASLDRFVRMASMLSGLNNSTSNRTTKAFDALASVADGSTQWRLVYDVTQRQINFRTVSHTEVKSVRATAFDFSCKTPVMGINLATERGGDVTDQFAPFTDELNEALVNESLGPSVPDSVLKLAVAYPGTTRCVETAKKQ